VFPKDLSLNKPSVTSQPNSLTKLSAVMITVDRGEKNYIETSIASLIDAGFFDYPGMTLEVFDSGSENTEFLNFLEDQPYPITVNYSSKNLELIENFARALESSKAHKAEYIIFMEDDIEVAPKLSYQIDQFIQRHQQDHKVWSFHASYSEIAAAVAAGDGHFNLPYPQFYGSLCFAVSAVDAHSLSAWLINCYRSGGNRQTADLQISEWLKHKMNVHHICCSVPSLVQHIGVTSSIRSNPGFIENTSYSLNYWP
jgi:hypothetical protein